MPLLQTLTPGEDSENNEIFINSVNDLGNQISAPDLTQYDNIKMWVRDSKKNLLAEYALKIGGNPNGNTQTQPYKLVIDQTDTNKLIFDLYGSDTENAAQGKTYANVSLIQDGVTDYNDPYTRYVPFIVFAKFGKPI